MCVSPSDLTARQSEVRSVTVGYVSRHVTPRRTAQSVRPSVRPSRGAVLHTMCVLYSTVSRQRSISPRCSRSPTTASPPRCTHSYMQVQEQRYRAYTGIPSAEPASSLLLQDPPQPLLFLLAPAPALSSASTPAAPSSIRRRSCSSSLSSDLLRQLRSVCLVPAVRGGLQQHQSPSQRTARFRWGQLTFAGGFPPSWYPP